MPLAHVLLADDDEFLRAVVEKRLVNVGYTVTAVNDGAEALNALDCASFDLIILDGEMPVTDGFSVLRQLHVRRAAPDVPVIMLTALKAQQHEQQARRLGVAVFMTKPFDPRALIACVDDLLAARARQGRAASPAG